MLLLLEHLGVDKIRNPCQLTADEAEVHQQLPQQPDRHTRLSETTADTLCR